MEAKPLSSSVNLWVRANLNEACPDTAEMIPPERHDEYHAVMGEWGAAQANLNEALARFAAARLLQSDFFKGLAYE